MLIIQSKLIDFKTKKIVGVICINGETSVALTIDKAKELQVEDIDIVEYLGVEELEVAVRPSNTNSFAELSKSLGDMVGLGDVNFERVGSILCPMDCIDVIWGKMFNFISFIELDNDIAIRRALSNSERS